MVAFLPWPRSAAGGDLVPSPPLRDAVRHFNFVAFLFVPNVCNARCEFCYVAPRFSESARFPRAMLEKISVLAEGLSAWGFREVRLTGGEPLVFDNIAEAVSRITSAGLRYRLLTNGINLPSFADTALSCPPCHITISVHDIRDQEQTFGVAVDSDSILRSISRLAPHVPIECTIVVERCDWSAVDNTLGRLAAAGVAGAKLILANVPGSRSRRAAFDDLAALAHAKYSSAYKVLRSSRTDAHSCRLTEKGFLSIDLPSMQAYACCVQPGEAPEVTGDCGLPMRTVAGGRGDISLGYDPLVIIELAAAARAVNGFPCTAHYGACPIALKG